MWFRIFLCLGMSVFEFLMLKDFLNSDMVRLLLIEVRVIMFENIIMVVILSEKSCLAVYLVSMLMFMFVNSLD